MADSQIHSILCEHKIKPFNFTIPHGRNKNEKTKQYGTNTMKNSLKNTRVARALICNLNRFNTTTLKYSKRPRDAATTRKKRVFALGGDY